MANQEHVDLIKQGSKVWNAWRRVDVSETSLPGIILSKANLSEANFYRTYLAGAYLDGANLSKANLSEACLSKANLTGADLTRANLSKTHLSEAYLTGANLTEANLTEANLTGVYLTGVILRKADLTNAYFSSTIFADLDLSNAKGLEAATHGGRSYIDINTVVFPHDEPTRRHFLRGVGFTETQIDYLPSLLTMPLQYHSLFLSYANPDEALARRLYQDLQNKGVRCWMAPHDLRPGDYHHSRIDEAIHLHEKTLLLLSEHAVNSSWVKHEVQVALAREVTQDTTVLFPLRLDEAIMRTDKDWAVRLRESRHIGDWTFWQNERAYQQAFTQLLQQLKITQLPA